MKLNILRSLIFINCIIAFGAVPSYYSETYNGYTLVIPLTDGETRSPLTLFSVSIRQWCTTTGFTLPRIRNKSDQENIANFIRTTSRKYPFPGRQRTFINEIYQNIDDWKWVNGQKSQGFTVKSVHKKDGVEGYFFGYLWTGDYLIHESRSHDPRNYICEKSEQSGNICEMKHSEKCYWKRHGALTWYEARNQCLTEGGDLASFETLVGKNLKHLLANLGLNASTGYWVGIYKIVWRWSDTDIDSEIKYTNWKRGEPSNYNASCLCLDLPPNDPDGAWTECKCEKSHPFICIHNGTSGQIPLATSLLSTTSVASNTAGLVFELTFCVPIVVIIVVIVVAAFIIWKKQRRNRSVNSSRDETPEARTTAAANEHPVYALIQKHGEDRSTTNCSTSSTTYATVQPDANINKESQTNNIVYAELDLPPRA